MKLYHNLMYKAVKRHQIKLVVELVKNMIY